MAKSSFRNLSNQKNIRNKLQELANKAKESRADELSLDSNIPNIENLEDEEQKALEKKLKEEEERQRKEEEELRKREEKEKREKEQEEEEESITDEEDENESEPQLSKKEWIKENATYKEDEGLDYKKILQKKREEEQWEATKDVIRNFGEDRMAFEKRKEEGDTWFGEGLLKKLEGGARLFRDSFLKPALKDTITDLKIGPFNSNERARNLLNKEEYKEYKRALKEEDESKNNVALQLNKNMQLLAENGEGEGEKSVEEIANDVNNLYKKNKGDLEAYSNLSSKLVEHSAEMQDFSELYNEAVKNKNTQLAEDYQKQISYHWKEYVRDIYEYALGVDLKSDSYEDLLKEIQGQLGGKVSINDIEQFNVKQINEKEQKVIDVQTQLERLQLDFEIRSNYNVAQLSAEAIINTSKQYGAIIGSDQEDIVFGMYNGVEDQLQWYDAKIKEAKEAGNIKEVNRLNQEKQNYKYGMSIFTNFVQDAYADILQGRTDQINDILPTIMFLFQSKETFALKELLTDQNTYKQFTDSKGNIDYKALGEYLEKSEQVKNFGALEGSYIMSAEKAQRKANNTNFFRDVEYKIFENYNIQQKGTHYLAGVYADLYKKYLDNGGQYDEFGHEYEFTDDYINNVLGEAYDFSVFTDRQLANLRQRMTNDATDEAKDYMVKGLKDTGQRRGDKYTDDIVLGIKRMDPNYANNQYIRYWNTLESIGDTIQAHPRDTFHTAIAIALPFVGGGLAAGLEGSLVEAGNLFKMGNTTRKLWKAGAVVLGEVGEGQIMNAIFDSVSYGGDPQAMWNIVDGAVGVFKAIPYVKELAAFSKFKKAGKLGDTLKSIEKTHGSAITKIADLTNAELDDINKAFNDTGLGKILRKDATKYLTESNGKVEFDLQQMYKDYSTDRLLYLGIGEQNINKNILKKLQEQSFLKELDKLDERTLNALYKRAQKWIGNKNIVNDILKNGDKSVADFLASMGINNKGRKAVIAYWLRGELGTLKQIGNVKAANAILKLAEGTGDINKAMNEKFGTLISTLENAKVNAKSPEEVAFLDSAISDAKELWYNERMLPLMFNEQNFDKALQMNKILADDFNQKYVSLRNLWQNQAGNGLIAKNGELLAVADGGISGLDQHLVDMWLAGDKEGIVREILGNQDEYEKIGVKVYNVDEYKKAIEDMSNNMLTDSQKARLGQILDTLNKVNNNSINIIELPENLRKQISGLQGFMGYIEEGGKQQAVITLGSSLVGGVKNKKFKDIKVLCHELGHTLFFSLKKQVQSQLVLGLLNLIEGKEMGPELLRKLVPNLSAGRIDVLMDLYKKANKTEFVEEVVADMLGNAIAKGIKGDENAIMSVGDNIMNQMAKGNKIKEFVGTDQPFQIIGNRFVDMLTILKNAIDSNGGFKELNGIMHYIAATVLEGGEISAKMPKTFKESQKLRVFRGKLNTLYGYKSVGNILDSKYGKATEIADITTPEFRDWFGNSKIVQKDGTPLMVYHGTHGEFTDFSDDMIGTKTNNKGIFGKGHYFTSNENYAKRYASENWGSKGHVLDGYLSLQNPYVIENWMTLDNSAKRAIISDLGLPKNFNIPATKPGEPEALRSALEKKGYDGMWVKNINEDGIDEIVIFNKGNFKSKYNVGTWDRNKGFYGFEETVDNANYNYYKSKGEKADTLGRSITEYDVAKIYSTQLVINAVENSKISVEELGKLLSTKRLDTDLQYNILRGLDEKGTKRFQKAMTLAEERQGLALNSLLKFWKNGKLDLKQEIDGLTFSDILSNIAPNITKDGYVEWAGVDLIKYLNGGNKEVYNDLFVRYMKLMESEYDPKVVDDIVDKLQRAGIQGEGFSNMYVSFANKVQDSIITKAKEAGMSADMAKSISEDVVSRLFAGSFYYMSNLYYLSKESDLTKLVDDMAYGLLLKNKDAASGGFNSLYNSIIKQYEKSGTFDATFSRRLSKVSKGEVAGMLGIDATDFRWNKYWKDVFNRLATRTHGFIESTLKELGEIELGQKYWVSFINKIGNQNSQIKTIIGKRIADAGIDVTKLDLDGLDKAKTIDEVVDIYVDAIKENDPKILEMIPDKKDRTALINELENIKKDGFTDADYDWLLGDLETKYMQYTKDGQSLTDYFEASLTADKVSELNRIDSNFAKSKMETIPSTWTDEMKKSAAGIDTILLDPEVEKQLGVLTEEVNRWNKLVEEGEAGEYSSILDFMLNDDTFKPFFNISDPAGLVRLKTDQTTSSLNSIRKMLIKVESNDNINMGKGIGDLIGKYVNITSIAAKDAEVGRIIQGALDFVNGRKVYIGKGAIKDFFDLIGADFKGKNYVSLKTIANEIIKVLEDEGIRQGNMAAAIFNDIADRYAIKYKTTSFITDSGEKVTKASKRTRMPKAMAYQGGASEKYKAAIDAYVDLLTERHSTFGWFKITEKTDADGTAHVVNELKDIFNNKLNKTPSTLAFKGSEKAREASKLQGLQGYWLGAPADDIEKLNEKAAIWNPDLFNNFLYKAYTQTNSTFNLTDKLIKGYRKGENIAANTMYTLFYSPLSGIPAASQQVVTNYLEIVSKTLGEMGDIDIDPQVYDDLINLVGELMPSEIVSRKGGKIVANRAELDVPTRTKLLGKSLRDIVSASSTLTWADKSAENMVIHYALVSSLMDMGFNGQSTKELVSLVVAKLNDFGKLGIEDIMDLKTIIKSDPNKVKYIAQSRINKLKQEGKLTQKAGNDAYKYIVDLNETTDPLRYAAKQANFKKNAFFQISNVPELTQNIIGGWAGPANMRFINWASRKAGEYTFNIADAIARKDWEQLGKYFNSLMLRGLFATKIYAQLNKATKDAGGTNYHEYMKTTFLPYTVLNMALLSAFDTIEDAYSQTKDTGMSGLISALTQGILGFGDNLKGRLSYSYAYWYGQLMSTINGTKMLSEKTAASDYFSGPLSSIPVVNYIEEVISKALTNRITKFFNSKVSGIYGNDPYEIATSSSIVNVLLGSNVTNDAIGLQKLQTKMNNLLYGEEGFSFLKDGTINIELIGFKRDSKYAYMAYNKFLQDSGLDGYLKLGTNYGELQEEYDDLYNEQKFYKSIAGLGIDVDAAKSLGKIDEDLWNEDWSELAGSDKVSIVSVGATPWADSVLNLSILQSASLKGLLYAGEGITTEERKDFEARTDRLLKEMLEEIKAQDEANNKLLYAKAYDEGFIRDMIKKYGNTYGEEMIVASSIKALVSEYKSNLTKEAKEIYGKGNAYQKWAKQEGGADLIAREVAQYKNDLVKKYYPTLVQGNQVVANSMMYSHAAMREDNPLSSTLSLSSALGAPIEVEWIKRNVAYQGLSTLGLDSMSTIYMTKILNSSDVSEQDKVDFAKDAIDYASQQGPLIADLTKAGLAIPMLKHYTELYNTDPSLFDDNPQMFEDAMKMLTVSRPLSDEDIKAEVRKSVFKSTGSGGSGSGSRGRKGSLSFDKLADNLTKFQVFKRQFEKMVLNQEPLQRIAYKATSHGVTPIQLSVGEAHEIDQKYTFITPKKPESEKTPDIVVKQVKTTSSKYSGKAIKQSNVYKVKKIL